MSRPLRAWLLLAARVIQAAALLTPTIGAASGSPPIRNAGFETVDGGGTCQSIPGWTLNGTPTSAISVVEDADGPALRISNGKAFCYGLGIDPAADYVLTIQVRAEKARPRVETEPPLPGGQPAQGSQTTFDWKTIEFRLPAAQRPAGVRECWIALGAEPAAAGGAVWYRSVRLEPVGGGPNAVRNPTFSEPVVEMTVPPGWSMESGGAGITCDSEQSLEGSHGLKVTGIGRPVRISQPVDMAAVTNAGTRRIRISGWGKSRGLGSDRIHLEVYGASDLQGPLLSLSGDADWTKGEAIIDLGRQQGRNVFIWINAPRDFQGDAWFDDIRIEPVPDDEVVNLLSNASFHPSIANARLPDYWGLWGDAVLCVEPWTLDLFGLVDDPGPFPPARVLRVQHPRPGNFVPTPPNKRLAMFVLTGSRLELPQGQYTFSIYAKADRPDTAVHIRHPSHEMPLKTARIGPKWQRIEATGTNASLLAAIHVPDPGSVVWLSAPQLEPGRKASPFRPAPGEGGILPPREPAVARSPLRSDTAEDAEATRPPGSPLAVYAEYDHVLNEPGVRARVEWSGPVPATVHWRLLDAITGAKLPVQQQSIDIDEPGIYHVALGARGRVDLYKGGIPARSVGHRHGEPGTAIAKIVDFELSAGHYKVALSGMGPGEVTISISR